VAKVSVIIPTFNRADYLRIAINSVLSQTMQDFEIIIADNASADSTPEVVRGYDDSRIRYLRHATNLGRHENGRRALDLVRGKYFIFLCDDDYFYPFALEKLLEIIEDNNSLAFVGCNFTCIDKAGKRRTKEIRMPSQDFLFEKYDFIEKHLRDCFCMPASGVLYQSSMGLETCRQLPDEVGAGDIAVAYQLNCEYPLYYISEPLFYYRIHGEQHVYENDYISKQATQSFIFMKEFLHLHGLRRFDHLLKYRTLTDTVGYTLMNFPDDESLSMHIKILQENEMMPLATALTAQLAMILYFAGVMVPTADKGGVDKLYQDWRILLYDNMRIGDYLLTKNIKKVAIFGTLNCAYFLLKDMQLSGVEVVCFLDNAQKFKFSHGIPVYPSRFAETMEIDAILLSIEGDHDVKIRKALQDKLPESISVYTWKEIVKYLRSKVKMDLLSYD
jgi:glycosyltransferase involved in cell wall biosynthesis